MKQKIETKCRKQTFVSKIFCHWIVILSQNLRRFWKCLLKEQ